MRELIGTNVKAQRIAKGWTQEELAEKSGFSQQYVSGLERGKRNPTIVTVYELAQVFGCSHLDLLQVDGATTD